MPGVVAREDQAVDVLLRILKKQIEKSGIMADLKKQSFYEKPSVKKKKKSILARKRIAKQSRY